MRNSIVLIFLLALLTQCGGEFIPDPLDPRLPRYSEEGKNAAGCFINGDVWRAVQGVGSFKGGTNETLRVNFQSEDSTIHIAIDGWRNESDDSLRTYTEIIFALDNREAQLESVRELHRKTFLLDGEHNYGQLIQPFADTIGTSGTGQITIRRVGLDSVTSSSTHYIIAGTFSFTTTSNSLGRIEIRNGRFDYSIRELNN